MPNQYVPVQQFNRSVGRARTMRIEKSSTLEVIMKKYM